MVACTGRVWPQYLFSTLALNSCLDGARLLQVGMSPIRTCPKGLRKAVNRACGAKGLLLLGGLCIGTGVLVSFLIHNEYPKLLNSVVVVSIPHRVAVLWSVRRRSRERAVTEKLKSCSLSLFG